MTCNQDVQDVAEYLNKHDFTKPLEQAVNAAILERALIDEGHEILCRLTSAAGLAEKVRSSNPDVVIVDMDAPDRDTLESMALVQRDIPRPMVMFCNQDDEELVVAALRAGVSAYVAGETDLTRVLEEALRLKPSLLILDSIQMAWMGGSGSSLDRGRGGSGGSGAASQLRRCASELAILAMFLAASLN